MFEPPVKDIIHAVTSVFNLDKLLAESGQVEIDASDIESILNEAGKFARERLEPLNRVGDENGTQLKGNVVTTAPGWKEAYSDWIEAGWNGISGPEDFGGQNLSETMLMATYEVWASSNQAFTIGPLLTAAAIKALHKHGSATLKATYLEKLVSGEWAGTMQLTENQSGSDLSQLRTKATRNDDGSYSLTGTKIFITYGDHDLTENIIHFVLARLDDAPDGTKGISLFLVPKFLVNQDGSLGERNDVYCTGLEDKLGLHGSPTCTMTFGDHGGAIGYLIGDEHAGLKAMFTMMNTARLGVGIQGVGIAEAAYQQSYSYAQERRQGRTSSDPTSDAMAPIIEHVDVQRMLLDMRVKTEAVRLICYRCAIALDSTACLDGDRAESEGVTAALLIPVAKAFSTDIGNEVAMTNIQVHGGMGYMEETGAAQHLRDARIFPIYEGTNGIQAIDLMTRKLPMKDGQVIALFINELRGIVNDANHMDLEDDLTDALTSAIDEFEDIAEWLRTQNAPSIALAGATSFLRLTGLVAGAAYLLKSSLADQGDKERLLMARYFIHRHLVEVTSLRKMILAGAQDLEALAAQILLDQ